MTVESLSRSSVMKIDCCQFSFLTPFKPLKVIFCLFVLTAMAVIWQQQFGSSEFLPNKRIWKEIRFEFIGQWGGMFTWEILCVDDFSSAALTVCVTARFPLIHKLDLRCFSSADSYSVSITMFRKAQKEPKELFKSVFLLK